MNDAARAAASHGESRGNAARLVLGIETSCDDTSVAILEDGRELRAHLIAAQDVHQLYGGVVPELAARAHLDLLPGLVERALESANIAPSELSAIAVTRGPGLVGSLVVGVAFAKAYALALGIPVVGVNHIEGHLHAATLEHGESPWPAVSLVVSGGHTELVEVNGFGEYRWLGSTRDDAAGEAYDKVAKRLGLGFPGGPVIDRLAARGNPEAFAFPRPMRTEPTLEFSFSGLKTAVATTLETRGEPPYPESLIQDVAASFQAAIVESLVTKTGKAIEQVGARALTLGGGVACNRELRRQLELECGRRGIALRIPSPRLCADNAAMIALVGAWQLEQGGEDDGSLDAVASLEAMGIAGAI